MRAIQAAFIATLLTTSTASAYGGDARLFARSMLMCSAKNTLYALGPGDAAVAAAAAPKSEQYLKAAVAAAGQPYVDSEMPKVKQEAMDTIMSQLQDNGAGDPMSLWQSSTKECDALLAHAPAG